jgi:hypothetical protein
MPEKDLTQRFVTKQKMRFVAQSWSLKGEELGRFLRRNGISFPELLSWREQMKDGMDDGKPLSRSYRRELQMKIDSLEKQLRQAHGIIELQKKVQEIRTEAAAKKLQKKSEKKFSKKLKK